MQVLRLEAMARPGDNAITAQPSAARGHGGALTGELFVTSASLLPEDAAAAHR